MNVHPKIKAAAIVAAIYAILVGVGNALAVLPQSHGVLSAEAALGAILPVLAGYAKAA